MHFTREAEELILASTFLDLLDLESDLSITNQKLWQLFALYNLRLTSEASDLVEKSKDGFESFKNSDPIMDASYL